MSAKKLTAPKIKTNRKASCATFGLAISVPLNFSIWQQLSALGRNTLDRSPYLRVSGKRKPSELSTGPDTASTVLHPGFRNALLTLSGSGVFSVHQATKGKVTI